MTEYFTNRSSWVKKPETDHEALCFTPLFNSTSPIKIQLYKRIGGYSNKKINTFASVFPTSNPKYVFIVMLDEPKTNSEYIYNYRDGSGIKFKGTPFNTAGWTSVEVAGQIIEKIGPILATKYNEVY